MAGKLSTEILINLAGNLQAKARQYGANMSEFAARHKRSMDVVKATSEAAGRGIDALGNRYTGMIAGIGSSLTVKGVADFDAQIRRAATNAKLTTEQMEEMRKEVRNIANLPDIRLSAKVVLEGRDELQGLTGDYEFVKSNTRNQAMAMQAFNAGAKESAALLNQMNMKGLRDPKEIEAALDLFMHQFSIGSVPVNALAKVAPKLFSMTQGQGLDAAAKQGALLQMFTRTTGTEDEATTSIGAAWANLTDPANIKKLKSVGVNVYKPGTREYREPMDVIKDTIIRAGADEEKLKQIFDGTAIRGIRSMLKKEDRDLADRMVSGTVESGAAQKAAALNAQSFQSALQSLNNEYERFAESNLAKPIQDLADALNGLEPGTVQRWLEISKNVAIAGAGIVAARKAFQWGKGAWDLFGPGKGKGLPKGVTDVFGSGVMPVYVVNMGAGGLGGASGADLPDGRNRPNGPGGRPRPGQIPGGFNPLFLASTIPLLAEEPNLSDDQKNDMVKWAQERAKGSSLWKRVTDFFTSVSENPAITGTSPAHPYLTAPALQPSASPYPAAPAIQGEIRVVVEGDARVKSVRMDQPGIRLSAQAGVSSVEQG
ncbi:TPA: phage tail protein [Citrobacter freundii]|nr:phage tail protein [Citrobacter freundii]